MRFVHIFSAGNAGQKVQVLVSPAVNTFNNSGRVSCCFVNYGIARLTSENRAEVSDRPLGRKYRLYFSLFTFHFSLVCLSLFTLLPFTFHLSADGVSADGGRSVGRRRTNLSADGALPVIRRRTDDAQTADKNEINGNPLLENAFRKAEKRDY